MDAVLKVAVKRGTTLGCQPIRCLSQNELLRTDILTCHQHHRDRLAIYEGYIEVKYAAGYAVLTDTISPDWVSSAGELFEFFCTYQLSSDLCQLSCMEIGVYFYICIKA